MVKLNDTTSIASGVIPTDQDDSELHPMINETEASELADLEEKTDDEDDEIEGADLSHAPQWTVDAAAKLNADAEFAVMSANFLEAKDLTARATVDWYRELKMQGVDFSVWAIANSKAKGTEGHENLPYCDPGKTYWIGGTQYKNDGNRRIPMDVYREQNPSGKGTVPRSAYMYLVKQTTVGRVLADELIEYQKGALSTGTNGKYYEKGINVADCAIMVEKIDTKLRNFASTLRQVKKLADQWDAIEGLERSKIGFKATKVWNDKTKSLEEKFSGKIVLSDKDDPTDLTIHTHTDLLNMKPALAAKVGGTVAALRASAPTKKRGTQKGARKTGQVQETVQTTNLPFDKYVEYLRGVEDFEESNAAALRLKLADTKNQDVRMNYAKVLIAHLETVMTMHDRFAQDMGADFLQEITQKLVDLDKRLRGEKDQMKLAI